MPADRIERVQRIVERAARVVPELQATFIRNQCGGDADLIADVNAILPHYEAAAGFEPVRPQGSVWHLPGTTTFAEVAAEDDVSELEPTPPFCLGQYRIVEMLGRGGMGVVYRGEHATLRQSAAIKLLRRGFRLPEHRRRFALEVEILRRLQHPGIARLIYADTFDGPYNPRPYFVMEYVPGLPLTRYATSHALDICARMKLLSQVCAAVNYAHQRGIVHCDLKPANILVVNEGDQSNTAGTPTRTKNENRHSSTLRASAPQCLSAAPKILDFGVSRVVEFQSPHLPDSWLRFAGTPEYASPEQMAGKLEEVKPVCDVYSLGLIAHELLTGSLPRRIDGRLQLDLSRIRLLPSEPSNGLMERQFRHELGRVLSATLQRSPTARLPCAGPVGAEFDRLLERFTPPASRWAALKNRVRSAFAPPPDNSASAVTGALRAVVRSRVAAAMRTEPPAPENPP